MQTLLTSTTRVCLPKIVTLRRDDAAARAAIGPLTKNLTPKQVHNCVDASAWSLRLRQDGTITKPLNVESRKAEAQTTAWCVHHAPLGRLCYARCLVGGT